MKNVEKPACDEREASIRRLTQSGALSSAATDALHLYGAELLGFLNGVLHDGAATREVYSQVAERIWRGLATFRWECSLRTWAYTIARNELARHRTHRHKNEILRPEISSRRLCVVERSPTPLHQRTTMRAALQSLRTSLSQEDRELLVLRLDRDMAWKDLALTSLGIGASREQVERESARLRQRFQWIKRYLIGLAQREGILGQGERNVGGKGPFSGPRPVGK